MVVLLSRLCISITNTESPKGMLVQDAISVIETDCEVDFAPPLDYVEPKREERVPEPARTADGAG